ncbi:MAG: amidohydrolase [Clostridia bacterium]|nr:amidohydrolase [Clostridia bacterium]
MKRQTGERITRLAAELQPYMTGIRRSIHRFPETGWLEMRTSALIARELTEMGYEVMTGRSVCREEARMGVPDTLTTKKHLERVLAYGAEEAYLTQEMREGFTGVVGVLRCGEGPTVALRFDIDALGMQECAEETHRPHAEGFASVNKGMMHACGHDGHAAIGLGAAKVLMEMKDSLHGTVRLLFQPGEEGARGARAMVAAGHLDDVDVFIGSHIAPTDSLDDGDVTAGTYGSLATTKYDVIFTGKAAHAGGYPEKGSNALLAACTAALNLHAIARHSGGQSRVNVGTLHAGTGRNVIADRAVMQLEVRGETTEINAFVAASAVEICEGAARMQGCSVEMIRMGEAEGQHSDLCLIERIAQTVKAQLPDLTLSSVQNAQNWGSEDISIMMNRVQSRGGLATYMRVMTPMAGDQHTVTFDFDESVLEKSVRVFCAAAVDVLGGE